MKAIVKQTVKTRNGGRKTVSEEVIGSKPKKDDVKYSYKPIKTTPKPKNRSVTKK